jgi:hypothetical protein
MLLRYPDGSGMTLWMRSVPRVGEFIWNLEGDATPEHVVRIVRVIYDLRHSKILLDVEPVSTALVRNYGSVA